MQATTPVVAIIDDDQSTRRALRRLILSLSYSPTDYASGDAFLESLPQSRPGCALLDLHMPGLNGLEVLLRMRSDGLEVPTIIITANATADMRGLCLKAGAAAYLTKPLDPALLAAAIEAAMQA